MGRLHVYVRPPLSAPRRTREQRLPGTQPRCSPGPKGSASPRTRRQMLGQPSQEAQQHAALRIVNRMFDRRVRSARQPRRGLHTRAAPPFGKRSAWTISTARPTRRSIFSRAHAKARGSWPVSHDTLHPSPASHRRDHRFPGADVESSSDEGSGASATSPTDYRHAGKHAIVGVDAAANAGYFNALLTPLVGADQPSNSRSEPPTRLGRAITPPCRLPAHLAHAAWNTVIGLQRSKQHSQMRARCDWNDDGSGIASARRRSGLARLAVDARAMACCNCAHSGNLAPQQRLCPRWPGEKAASAVNAIISRPSHAWRRRPALRAPACGPALCSLGPFN